MSDLISRKAELDAMETLDKFGCDPDGKLVRYDDDKHYTPYVRYEDMVHAIKHLPSAQPEIIRCKDCRHNNWCDMQEAAMAGDNFFCGAAERTNK